MIIVLILNLYLDHGRVNRLMNNHQEFFEYCNYIFPLVTNNGTHYLNIAKEVCDKKLNKYFDDDNILLQWHSKFIDYFGDMVIMQMDLVFYMNDLRRPYSALYFPDGGCNILEHLDGFRNNKEKELRYIRRILNDTFINKIGAIFKEDYNIFLKDLVEEYNRKKDKWLNA